MSSKRNSKVRITATVAAVGIALLGRSPATAAAEPIAGFEQRDSAQATYTANALSVLRTELTVGSWPFSSTTSSWRIVRGNYRYPVTHVDFLRAVGRSDMADSFASSSTRATVLFWSGLGLFVVGTATIFYGVSRESDRTMIAGLGIGGAGLLLARFGGAPPELPLSEDDALAAAVQFNRQLGTSLGLSSVSALPPPQGWRLALSLSSANFALVSSHTF